MLQAIVTDIEGTTTSLSFVKDVLFPYARAHLGDFVRKRATDPRIAPLLEEVGAREGKAGLEEVIAQLNAWIDADAKVTALKFLQGLLWEQGYRNGDFSGHVYPDAVRNLRAWQRLGLALYIFSSGSVQAQKLLFEHTPFGNLTGLFDGYFDTRTGSKLDAVSYQHIAQSIGLPAGNILFLSDVEQELAAAAAVGMETIWLRREGEVDPEAPYVQVRDFDAIKIKTLLQDSSCEKGSESPQMYNGSRLD